MVLAPSLAYATNESSYKYGYDNVPVIAKCEARSVLTNNGDDCARGEITPGWACVVDKSTPAVTNNTACNDGFVNGFVHWCAGDMKGCAAVIKSGNFSFNSTEYDKQQMLDTKPGQPTLFPYESG
ncbi:MAG: hypothetical protein WA364_30720 [Candidatus Nitrosopolaris sp.]